MIFSYAAVFARYFTRGVSIPFPSCSRYLYQNWAGLIPVLMTFTLWFTDKFIVNLFKIPGTLQPISKFLSVFIMCKKKFRILTLAFGFTSLTPPPPLFMHDYATFVVSQLKPCFRISIWRFEHDSRLSLSDTVILLKVIRGYICWYLIPLCDSTYTGGFSVSNGFLTGYMIQSGILSNFLWILKGFWRDDRLASCFPAIIYTTCPEAIGRRQRHFLRASEVNVTLWTAGEYCPY